MSDSDDKAIQKRMGDWKARKGTTSGFSVRIYKDLEDWNDIKFLYNPAECVNVINGKKTSIEDTLTLKKRFDVVDSFFNSDGEYRGNKLVLVDGK